jgi:integrase
MFNAVMAGRPRRARTRLLLQLSVLNGLSIPECTSLTWGDVRGGHLRLLGTSGERRIVPLPQWLVDELAGLRALVPAVRPKDRLFPRS